MMNQNNLIDVIIPVAGKGERFYPHTKYTQKCLLPVGDKPILGHILSKIHSLNINSVKLITGHFQDKVKEYIENPNKFVFTIALKDRFSDSGNIGVIFFTKTKNTTTTSDSSYPPCHNYAL